MGYVARAKGDVRICAGDARYFYWGQYRSDGAEAVNLAMYREWEHKTPGIRRLLGECQTGGVAVSEARMPPERYFRGGKQYFTLDRGR